MFGEAKETIIAACSMILFVTCVAIAMFIMTVGCLFIDNALYFLLRKKQKVLAVHLTHTEVGHKAKRFQILHVPPAHLHASKSVLIDMAFNLFNPKGPKCLCKRFGTGVEPPLFEAADSASLLHEFLKEKERADAFPGSCKCLSSSSL